MQPVPAPSSSTSLGRRGTPAGHTAAAVASSASYIASTTVAAFSAGAAVVALA